MTPPHLNEAGQTFQAFTEQLRNIIMWSILKINK